MVPKSEKMQRQAQTNKQKAYKSQLPRRNRERRIGGFILYLILELSFEDSAPIKLFFSVWWFDGKQRRLVAVTDGQWWWRRRLWVLREGLGEEVEKEMALLRCWTFLQPARLVQAKFGLPGRADLAQIVLLRLKYHISYLRYYISIPNGPNVRNWVTSL